MRKTIALSPTKISKKHFLVRGDFAYDAKEVDEFLDLIIEDYEHFSAIIDDLSKENIELKKQISYLKHHQEPVVTLNSKRNLELIKENNALLEENTQLKKQLKR